MQGTFNWQGYTAKTEKLSRYGRLAMGDDWCLGIEGKVEHSPLFYQARVYKRRFCRKTWVGIFLCPWCPASQTVIKSTLECKLHHSYE